MQTILPFFFCCVHSRWKTIGSRFRSSRRRNDRSHISRLLLVESSLSRARGSFLFFVFLYSFSKYNR